MNKTTDGSVQNTSFGATLRGAIIVEFGSQRIFARAFGVSPGRISQIIGGPSSVDPSTLARLLGTFVSRRLQEDIHAAWAREFAPKPGDDISMASGEEALTQGLNLWHCDRPRQALKVLSAARRKASNPGLWLELSGIALVVNMRLGRSGVALGISREMEEQSRVAGEPGHLLTTLWMRGLALRNVSTATVGQLMRAYQDAHDLAFSMQLTGDWRNRWLEKRMQLLRDFALHILTAHELGPVAPEGFAEALRRIESAAGRWEDPVEAAITLEVRSRLEVAVGQLVKAEETLDEIRACGALGELPEKTGLVRAKIAIARGDLDLAKTELLTIAQACLAKTNLHHYRTADQLLAKVELFQLRGRP